MSVATMLQSARRLGGPGDTKEVLVRMQVPLTNTTIDSLELRTRRAYNRGVHQAYAQSVFDFLGKERSTDTAIADILALSGPSSVSKMRSSGLIKGEHYTSLLHSFGSRLSAPHKETCMLYGIACAASFVKSLIERDPAYLKGSRLRPNELSLLLETMCRAAWHCEKDNADFLVLRKIAHDIVSSAPMLGIGDEIPELRPEQCVRLLQELYIRYADAVIASAVLLIEEVR